MNHRRSSTQKYFEFALWAGRRRTAPSVREVAAYFNIHLESARRLRHSWLNARAAVATATAQACAERIEDEQLRKDAFGAAIDRIFHPSASAEPSPRREP